METPAIPPPAPSPKEANHQTDLAPTLHLKRPCLTIADLDRSLVLYRDTLGFRLDYVGEASPESYLYPVFDLPANAQLRFAALSTAREPRALALTEVKGIELPPPPTPRRAAIVIQVPDVASTIETLHSLELHIIRSSSFTAPPNLRFTEQAFFDYDHHLIVLYDVKPENKLD